MTSAPPLERFWWRPRVERWIPFVVSVAAFVTLVMVTMLADLAWNQADLLDRPSMGTEIGAVLGGIGAAGVLAMIWTRRYRDVSPWARAAVALVCVHIALAAGAWFLASRMRPATEDLPLLSVVPAPAIALGAGLFLFIAAFAHTRFRRMSRAPGWLRGTVVFALAYVLLLGIMMPLVIPDHADRLWNWWPHGLDAALRAVLIPPAVIAFVIAAITVVRPAWLNALAVPGVILVTVMIIGSMASRDGASATSLIMYANFLHVLFAAAWFALCALAALAWAHVRMHRANREDTARPAPWVQRGIVEAPAGTVDVGAWHVDGWLAGARTSLGSFTLRTQRGESLAVPDGARLVAAMSSAASGAGRGDRIPVLMPGDQVIVSGFVEGGGDGPYRSGGLPVPGTDGLVVTLPRRPHESIGRDVVLALYRPCVLFLVVVALAALPGLVGNGPERAGPPASPYHR